MPQRVIFSIEARADLPAIDRETALRLLEALARFLVTDIGDVKQLEGFDPPRYRLRIGHWRLIFRKPAMAPSKLSASATGERPIANQLGPCRAGLLHTSSLFLFPPSHCTARQRSAASTPRKIYVHIHIPPCARTRSKLGPTLKPGAVGSGVCISAAASVRRSYIKPMAASSLSGFPLNTSCSALSMLE